MLEFELIRTAPEEEPYFWVRMRSGDVEIMLQTRESFIQDAQGWAFLKSMQIGGTSVLYIEMENIDEFYERVRSKLEPVFELADEPYGMREFTIRDCNGYVLAFGQRI